MILIFCPVVWKHCRAEKILLFGPSQKARMCAFSVYLMSHKIVKTWNAHTRSYWPRRKKTITSTLPLKATREMLPQGWNPRGYACFIT